MARTHHVLSKIIINIFNLVISSNLNHNSSCNCNNTSSSESHSLVSVNNGEAAASDPAVAAADPADPADPVAHPGAHPGDPGDPTSAEVLSPHHSKPSTAATSDKKRPSFR